MRIKAIAKMETVMAVFIVCERRQRLWPGILGGLKAAVARRRVRKSQVEATRENVVATLVESVKNFVELELSADLALRNGSSRGRAPSEPAP